MTPDKIVAAKVAVKSVAASTHGLNEIFSMTPEKLETLGKGLIASLYGLGGVFAVLILFYIITKIMMANPKEN
jgi:sugar phosphate permease